MLVCNARRYILLGLQAVDQVRKYANRPEILRRVVIVINLDVKLLLAKYAQFYKADGVQSYYRPESIIKANITLCNLDKQILDDDCP